MTRIIPCDPRGSVAGMVDIKGHLAKTYQYSATRELGSEDAERIYNYPFTLISRGLGRRKGLGAVQELKENLGKNVRDKIQNCG